MPALIFAVLSAATMVAEQIALVPEKERVGRHEFLLSHLGEMSVALVLRHREKIKAINMTIEQTFDFMKITSFLFRVRGLIQMRKKPFHPINVSGGHFFAIILKIFRKIILI